MEKAQKRKYTKTADIPAEKREEVQNRFARCEISGDEAAKLLGVSRHTFYRIRRNEPPRKVGRPTFRDTMNRVIEEKRCYEQFKKLPKEDVRKVIQSYQSGELLAEDAARQLKISKLMFLSHLKRHYGGLRTEMIEHQRKLSRRHRQPIQLKYYKKVVIYVLETPRPDYKGPEVLIGENGLEKNTMNIKISNNVDDDEDEALESAPDEEEEEEQLKDVFGDDVEYVPERTRKGEAEGQTKTYGLRPRDSLPKLVRMDSDDSLAHVFNTTEEVPQEKSAAYETIIGPSTAVTRTDEEPTSTTRTPSPANELVIEGDLMEHIFGSKYLLSPQLQPTMVAVECNNGDDVTQFWTYIHTGDGWFKCFNCKDASERLGVKFPFPSIKRIADGEYTEPNATHNCQGSVLAELIGTELDRRNRRQLRDRKRQRQQVSVPETWEEGWKKAESLSRYLGLPRAGKNSIQFWYPSYEHVRRQYAKILDES